jgi:hypothetical protein
MGGGGLIKSSPRPTPWPAIYRRSIDASFVECTRDLRSIASIRACRPAPEPAIRSTSWRSERPTGALAIRSRQSQSRAEWATASSHGCGLAWAVVLLPKMPPGVAQLARRPAGPGTPARGLLVSAGGARPSPLGSSSLFFLFLLSFLFAVCLDGAIK